MSYGSKDGKIVVRQPPQPPDPYVVINPLPPSRIEWLRQQSLRVAAVFRARRKP
jgi:hypothetical protein